MPTGHPDEPIDPDVAPAAAPPVAGPRLARIVAVIAAGGAIGAPARYELALAVTSPAAGFPVSTFVINVSGSFVLGVLLTLVLERWPPTVYVRPFAVTGVLGAYTTWSTFMVDTDLLIKGGHVAVAAGYVAATLVGGLAAVFAGMLLARTLGSRPTSGSQPC